MDDLKRLGDLADLEPHGQFSKWIEGHDILVYRLDGEIKAISNICRHFGGPIGYHGLSLGSAIGVPLVAAERRIKAAVLGLMGHETLTESASRISVPVEFVLQWDDEIVPRESGLALFDAIGSAEKTMHANPGGHMDVPAFEVDNSERFFIRHLAAS